MPRRDGSARSVCGSYYAEVGKTGQGAGLRAVGAVDAEDSDSVDVPLEAEQALHGFARRFERKMPPNIVEAMRR